jgi:hypothetical protein
MSLLFGSVAFRCARFRIAPAFLSSERLCRNPQNRPNVILNEVKNLMYSIHCTTQIPRLRLGMTLRHSL